MSPEVFERSFEEAIECGLLRRGPDACAEDAAFQKTLYCSASSGGYQKRAPEHYDRGLCLIPSDVIDFVLATQPKQWEKLRDRPGVIRQTNDQTRQTRGSFSCTC
jgi:type I restriction enzyme R subunit